MDEESGILGILFEENQNALADGSSSIVSFDMWGQCSLKNIRRVNRKNRALKPIRVHLLKLVLRFCELAAVEPFVYGGTALSVYRENGQMIKHDSDIDMAALERDENNQGTFTKLLQACIKHGVCYSGVSGHLPACFIPQNSDITVSFDSKRTGNTWLEVTGDDVDSISERFFDGLDCKIAKFYLSQTGLEKACDMFGLNINALQNLLCDPSLVHVDLFTVSPHKAYPHSHLQVNWNIPGVYECSKKAFPISSIFPLKDALFENVKVRCPADLESYLKLEYGYLGRDAIFIAQKQLYVKLPARFRSSVPKYMLDVYGSDS